MAERGQKTFPPNPNRSNRKSAKNLNQSNHPLTRETQWETEKKFKRIKLFLKKRYFQFEKVISEDFR